MSNSVRTWGYKFHFSILILFPLGACPEVELLDYRIILFLIFKDLYTIFQWQPTPVLLPGKSHGWRSLAGTVHGVAKSRTWLSDFTFTFQFHALEKAMATHSSALAWRIPGMAEPGGLPSMGSHRVGHDWSDLAAAPVAQKGEMDTWGWLNRRNLLTTREVWDDSLLPHKPRAFPLYLLKATYYLCIPYKATLSPYRIKSKIHCFGIMSLW